MMMMTTTIINVKSVYSLSNKNTNYLKSATIALQPSYSHIEVAICDTVSEVRCFRNKQQQCRAISTTKPKTKTVTKNRLFLLFQHKYDNCDYVAKTRRRDETRIRRNWPAGIPKAKEHMI